MLTLIGIIGILSLIFAAFLTVKVLKENKGSKEMQEVANAIKEGSNAFMKRQYFTIAVLSLLLAVIIYITYYFIGKKEL